ncbi:MAG: SgcJ/EcaC family oxidoreductase [Rhizobacter sp.]|nr:SgcJ/EcaC family oxidoreductase [Burkholderiales bacterium]
MYHSFRSAAAVLFLTLCSDGFASPQSDVAAATDVWIEAMNARDTDRVVSLYDPTAVLWGTRSATIRDNPAAVREYFNGLKTAPTTYKVVVNDQRIRIFGETAVNSGAYTFSEVRDDKPILRPARFTFVFANRNGRWMIVDHHSSAVPAQ